MYNSIFILGPTASGKTSLSINLAKLLNTEIINADSLQIYKDLNIGTAKPTTIEQQGIKHNLIDFVEPTNEFSVNEFKQNAMPIIKKLIEDNKIPIIVGGTGFYVESLLNDYEYGQTIKDENVRNKLNQELEQFGKEFLHNKLKTIDPISASQIFPNDVKRVIRALEIYYVTGKTKHENNSTMQTSKNNILKPLIIVLNWNRDELYNRINNRTDIMISNGLIDEVKLLIKKEINLSNQCMQGIGYKEIYLFLNNEISLEIAIDKIKQGSRNYAKRQITWFKRIKDAIWFNCSEISLEEIVNFCLNKIKEM